MHTVSHDHDLASDPDGRIFPALPVALGENAQGFCKVWQVRRCVVTVCATKARRVAAAASCAFNGRDMVLEEMASLMLAAPATSSDRSEEICCAIDVTRAASLRVARSRSSKDP